MGAIDIGIGHDDDFVVAGSRMSNSSAMPVPSAVIIASILLVGEDVVEPRLLDVDDLALSGSMA